jgi:hypothetical protein
MCDKEVLKSQATKMPRIILQRDEVFSALQETYIYFGALRSTYY